MASDLDPNTAKQVANAAPDLWVLAIGALAAVLRLATYTGPPRPWRVLLADGTAQFVVGMAVYLFTFWQTGSPHAAAALGMASGLVGWEALKKVAARRLAR